MTNMTKNIYWVDLFCGAGGTSSGIHLSEGDVKVIACVNHDRNAINSHEENHPDTIHFVEDIRDLRVVAKIKRIVDEIRRRDPGCIINLWASLECTNFSRAKGGLSRNADSRTLAEHMYIYLEALKPDYFYVENVREFLDWGPLRVKCDIEEATHCQLSVDKKGQLVMVPEKTRLKEYYNVWVDHIKSYGYQYEYRLLNSADFGSYQSRQRLFIQFSKSGLPITWPKPTHSKKPTGDLLKWKPVREVLDLNNEGESIFSRKTPLVENSLKRIYAGLVKFVADGQDTFRQQYNGNGSDAHRRVADLNGPCGTILNNSTHAIVKTVFIQKGFSGHPQSKNITSNGPCGSVKTKDSHSVISAFMANYYSNGGEYTDITGPAGSVPTKDRMSLIHLKTTDDVRSFITNNYSGGGTYTNVAGPAGCISTVPKANLTTLKFMDQQYGNSKPVDLNSVSGTLTANPKFNLVSATPWLMCTNFDNVGRSLDEPAPTILSCKKHHYLLNPQYANKGSSVDNPCFTLIAGMGKAPPHIVMVERGRPAIVIYEDDSETMVKIKLFMAEHGIVDIKMRMLTITELLQIQGFPADYKLIGTQTEKKKYIGNAVEVNMARALVTANTQSIINHYFNVQTLSKARMAVA